AQIARYQNPLRLGPRFTRRLQNIHKDLRRAYDDNLSDYRDTIPHILHHNAIIVLGNGDKAKLGSITSKFEHFHEWKRLHEEEPGVVDMETLLKGVWNKKTFWDLFEHFHCVRRKQRDDGEDRRQEPPVPRRQSRYPIPPGSRSTAGKARRVLAHP